MTGKAPRRAGRRWGAHARGALLMLALVAPGTALAESEPSITAARYIEPTDRYAHGILGDAIEWGALELTLGTTSRVVLRLPQSRVFEDLAPRIVDLDGDDDPEVIVIETDIAKGARLAVYDRSGLVAATSFIGRTNRWLAPIGAADLDADGHMEIAYIDRPHLAKTLRIFRFQRTADGTASLVHLADQPGLTNHRIGEDFISGGIRDCGTGPEMVTADANWQNVMISRFEGNRVTARTAARFSRQTITDALACN